MYDYNPSTYSPPRAHHKRSTSIASPHNYVSSPSLSPHSPFSTHTPPFYCDTRVSHSNNKVSHVDSSPSSPKSPKYRAKPCYNYMNGSCHLGSRCHNVHLESLRPPDNYPSFQFPVAATPHWEWSPNGIPFPSDNAYLQTPLTPTHTGTISEFGSPISSDSSSSASSTPSRGEYRQQSSPCSIRSVRFTSRAPTYLPAPPVIPMFEQAKADKIAARNRAQSICANPRYIKTRPCKYFSRRGKCPKGEECTYIHEPEELQSLEPKTASSAAHSSATPCEEPTWRVLGGGVRIGDAYDTVNNKICPRYMKGHCAAGRDCRLSHDPSLRYRDSVEDVFSDTMSTLSIGSPLSRTFSIQSDDDDETVFESRSTSPSTRSKSNPTTPQKGTRDLPKFPAELP